jgi:hypothetical protein
MPKSKSTTPNSAKSNKKVKLVETKLGHRRSLGLWEQVDNRTSMITIDARLKGFQRLLIVLHEALHETCRDWTEEKVVDVSEFLARILWECDYRHVDHSGEAEPSYETPIKKDKKKTEAKTKEIWDTKNQS